MMHLEHFPLDADLPIGLVQTCQRPHIVTDRGSRVSPIADQKFHFNVAFDGS